MEPFKQLPDEILCRSEDGIFFKNGHCLLLTGDFISGFTLSAINIAQLAQQPSTEKSSLYPTLEAQNSTYIGIAGETSWGGAGFIGLKHRQTQEIKWILHLSSMNNPIAIHMDENHIFVKTDLNYPNGMELIVPIGEPQEFRIGGGP